jgi:Cu-processing system permease protein
MIPILQVARYTSSDLLRSRWTLVYTLFFLAFVGALFYFGEEPSQAVVSVLNLELLVVPLVSGVFAMTHVYNSRDFVELLLAQPIARTSVFWGQYLGLALSLAVAFVAGLIGPFLWYGLGERGEIGPLAWLLLSGVFLTLIFVGLAFLVSVYLEDRLKALGVIIFLWLYCTVLYDGLLLWFILLMQAYPLEKALIALVMLNPLDLSRTLILLRLDISALMGYTGAILQQFFGSGWGVGLSLAALVGWTVVPLALAVKSFSRKDF